MLFPILWVLLAAWTVTCLFYAVKIIRVTRGKGISLFALLGTSNRGSSSARKARNYVLNIVVATILFIITVLIAYFVRSSS